MCLAMGSKSLVVWNMCSLNLHAHRDAVRELVSTERPSIICLQETKLHVILDFDVLQILGMSFNYSYMPST
jgi:exonuclease III